MIKGERLREISNYYYTQYAKEQGITEASTKNRRNFIKRLLFFLGGKALTLETVKSYRRSLPTINKPSSIVSEIKRLRAFIKYLYNEKYINEDFGNKIIMPKCPKRRINPVNQVIAEKIIMEGTKQNKSDNKIAKRSKIEVRMGLRFMLRTGLRISSARSIKGADFYFDADVPYFIYRNKGKDEKIGYIPLDMINELRIRANNQKLFEMSEEACREALKRGCNVLGIQEMRVHDLRHSFASEKHTRDIALTKTQQLLAHSKPSTTAAYYLEYPDRDLAEVINTQEIVLKKLPPVKKLSNLEVLIEKMGYKSDDDFIVTCSDEEIKVSIREK